jgi:transketolase N-terminal domain/subunit
MDITTILEFKYKGSQWVLDGEDYEGLTWLSESVKPTKKQLEDLWPAVQQELSQKAQAKIDAKASAIAKLEALGLTVTEVEVAFGLTK